MTDAWKIAPVLVGAGLETSALVSLRDICQGTLSATRCDGSLCGLVISHKIVVERHHGKIDFSTGPTDS